MNCQQVNKLLERYDEGDLPGQIAAEVESHLQSCTDCQTLLQLVEKERTSLQSYADIPELSPEFASELMARISVAPRPKLVPIWVEWTRRYPTLLGAAAVILLFLFPLLGQTYRNDEIVPLTPPAAQKVAAVDMAQNTPFDAGAEPTAPVVSEASIYGGESRPKVGEAPSRSLQAKGLNANDNANSSENAALSLMKVISTDTEQMDRQSLPPAVVPSYIPTGYILDKIEIVEENRVVISYLPDEPQETAPLIVNITPDISGSQELRAMAAPAKEEASKILTEDPPKTETPSPAITAAPANMLTETHSVYDGHSYLITASIPLQPAEMENLSLSIAPRKP